MIDAVAAIARIAREQCSENPGQCRVAANVMLGRAGVTAFFRQLFMRQSDVCLSMVTYYDVQLIVGCMNQVK